MKKISFCTVLFIALGCAKDEPKSTAIADGDGNVYTTVTIGNQIWLGENLKTTKFNDGTSIPNVTDNITWADLTTPAHSWYNNRCLRSLTPALMPG